MARGPERIEPSGAVPGQAEYLGELGDEELGQTATAWPQLGSLLQSAPQDLHALLRNSFNLRLAAELLLAGTTVGELREVGDRLELLRRYWERRVSDQPGGLARGVLLGRVCDYAVRHRTLIVPVSEVLAGDTAAGGHLETLLSRSVLAESAGLPGGPAAGQVRFAHHVLFDYAVAVTVLAATDESFRVRLHDDPDLVLFARPSIDMHLERLWAANPAQFFEVGLAIAEDPKLPRLATVAVAEVAARSTEQPDDLDKLLGSVISGNASPGVLRLLRDIAVAVVIDREDAEQPRPGAWPAIVERLSANPGVTQAPLGIPLGSLVERGEPLCEADLARCGLAARRLLEHLWTLPPTPVTRFAIEAVIATAESDPPATHTLLRQALQTNQLTARGYNDLFWLTDSVPRLAGVVPGFVEELYAVVMVYEEPSTEPTQMITGRILPMVSTRRQDVDAARSNLVRHYGAFVEASPGTAIAALARVIASQHTRGATVTATLQGSPATITKDGSEAWNDRSSADGHGSSSLLTAFEDHLANHAGESLIAAVFDSLAAEPRPAAIWRRVLAAGARSEFVADRLVPLDETFNRLLIEELDEPLGKLVAARHAERLAEERARLEAAVIALKPGREDDGSPEWARADRRYRRFLHLLDPAAIVNPDAAAEVARTTQPRRVAHRIGAGEPYADRAERYGMGPAHQR